MLETFISKRIQFSPGEQYLFLETCKKKLGYTNKQLAGFLKIHIRTLTDWKREKFLLPLPALNILSRRAKLSPPKKFQIRDKFSDVTRAGRLGGIAVYRKHGRIGGDPEKWRASWFQWWKKIGKFLPHNKLISKRKIVYKPKRSITLAEFIGILMGDGGISARQVTITLDSRNDYSYSLFVMKFIKQLFKVQPSVYRFKENHALRIAISRTDLVDFCKKMGLKIGNKIKQGLDIPLWIKNNRDFQKACLRGLFDTDGCLVIHRYTVNGKEYCYKKLNFSSASPPLIASIMKILKKLGFHPRMSKNGRNIWLDDRKEVRKYIGIIGTHNPKHKERFLR